ncbi:MAG: CRISPR-associated helicase Cas3' [Coriobacteriia bacterium]
MGNEYWAHTESEERGGDWQPLLEHLEGVAIRAGEFGHRIGIPLTAETAGWLHDVGKYSRRFQAYLRESHELRVRQGRNARLGRTVDHKLASAREAEVWDPRGAGQCLGLVVAGHHGGLLNRTNYATLVVPGEDDDVQRGMGLDGIISRLPNATSIAAEFRPCIDRLATEVFLRMVYSCLADADALDTERHYSPSCSDLRDPGPDLIQLRDRLREAQLLKMANCPSTPVNALRAEIYSQCVAAASADPGCFRLTVPTGGGKTLSSLSFALEHAVAHGMDRVIYAIPYTSIIDQTVSAFESALGEGSHVLAHHSALPEPEGEDDNDQPDWRRLTAENWDAPIVVTTNVQFFGSLLGNKPGRSRKVHRIARSVVVLDEVQTLPARLLDPLLDVINALSKDWGTTFVLCSATQPAVGAADRSRGALTNLREIVPEYPAHFEQLCRVDYQMPDEPWPWSRLAEEMRAHEQCLTILNTRKNAISALNALDDPNALHLSTLLTPVHRRAVLNEIRRRLREGEECRVVATQVVEAGVDLDFPVVMRALGPLDRIIQAAGRCNREGRLDSGTVIIFEPQEGKMPLGEYHTGADLARMILAKGVERLHDPATSTEYFRALYENVECDAEGIQKLRAAWEFADVAKSSSLITQESSLVLIPDEAIASQLHALEDGRLLSRSVWRQLQQHGVSVGIYDEKRLKATGWLQSVRDRVYIWRGLYDEVQGLGDMAAEEHSLIV